MISEKKRLNTIEKTTTTLNYGKSFVRKKFSQSSQRNQCKIDKKKIG